METYEGNPVKILQEDGDEDYEPTAKEIREYADWLGIDPDEDQDLLWIARRGLMTPLPKPWKTCQSSDGEIFYFNPETGENTWDHPCDAELRELYSTERALKKANLERRSDLKTDDDAGIEKTACAEHVVISLTREGVVARHPKPPPAPSKSAQKQARRIDVEQLQTPLGLLGPLPPLDPPKSAISSEVGDPFDMPLDLGFSNPSPRDFGTEESDPRSPRRTIETAEALSPIATTEEIPSPLRDAIHDKTRVGLSANIAQSGGTAQPPREAIVVDECGRCCDITRKDEAEECGIASLSRELEALRSAMAAQASVHAAEQAKEQASSSSALLALSQELAHEAAESRRLRGEKATQEEALAALRVEAAARLAAEAQTQATLEAELGRVRLELEQAKKSLQSDHAPSPHGTKAAINKPQLPHLIVRGSQHIPPERSAEDRHTTSDLSPPTPDLVSVLVAELRPSAQHQQTIQNERGIGHLANLANAGSDANDKALTKGLRLWSQLKEDDNLAVAALGTPNKNLEKSLSLDFSSLSAALLEHSADLPGSHHKLDSSRDWPAEVAENRSPTHVQSCSDSKGHCLIEEVRCLRIELDELREEAQRRKSKEDKDEKNVSASVPQEIRLASKQEAFVEVATSDARLDSSTRCPPPALQARANEPSKPSLDANTLLSTHEEHHPQRDVEAQMYPGCNRCSSLSRQGRWKEPCQSSRGLLSACATSAPLQSREGEWRPSTSICPTLNVRRRWDEPLVTAAFPSSREARNRLENAEAELQRLNWELHQWRVDAEENERILRETRAALHREQASHVVAKALVRESHREAHQLRSRLRSQETEAELASNALQRMRTDWEHEENEKQRLQLCLQTRDMELQSRRKKSTHSEFLASWRKELRREHAILDEDRRLWRCEANRLKHQAKESHTEAAGMAQKILTEVRAALDARATILNNSIAEYRSLENSFSSGAHKSSSAGTSQALPGGSHRRAKSASAIATTEQRNNEDVDEKLRRRWHEVLTPSAHRAGFGGA